jgi:Cu/Ag efflux protein CusF
MKSTTPFFPAPRALITGALLLILAAPLAITTNAGASQPAPASGGHSVIVEEGVPGGTIVDTMEVNAKVTAIDTEQRMLTLMTPEGNEFNLRVGPEAVNFDQIQVNDVVTATVTKELIVFLDEEGAAAPDGAAEMVALAPKGAQPGAVAAKTVQVTGTVTKIDATNRTATLRFENGQEKTFAVRDDIDLSKRTVGERVVFQVTEMLTIGVEKQ